MDGVAGQRGWRWILILEGLPTIVLGITTWFFLADDADSAHYLSQVSALICFCSSAIKSVAAVGGDRDLGQSTTHTLKREMLFV